MCCVPPPRWACRSRVNAEIQGQVGSGTERKRQPEKGTLIRRAARGLSAKKQARKQAWARAEEALVLRAERGFLRGNSHGEKTGITGREYDCGQPTTVDQRHRCHLDDNRKIVGMAQPAVWSGRYRCGVGQYHDAGVPAFAERGDYPC